MSYVTKKNFSARSEYSVVYNSFKGVDFSEGGSEISRNRFAYLENMYRDYDRDGSLIESIPGYREIYDTMSKPCGLYSYKNSDKEDVIVLHAENILYQIPLSEIDKPKNVKITGGLSANEGDAYRTKDALYVLDGSNVFKVSKEFSGKVTTENDGIYVPTTHVNGVEYEQRNLLTRLFYEKYTLSSADAESFGTPSLTYSVTSEEKRECSVSGISGNETVLYIPSRTLIGDTYYSVKSIDTYAFRNNRNITECYISSGVNVIGIGAFSKCYSLRKAVISDTVTQICDSCFMDCENLSELHIGGIGLKTLGQSFISTCPSLKTATYSGSTDDFKKIVNYSALSNVTVTCNVKVTSLKIGLKLHNPAISVTSVKLDSTSLPFETVTENGLCTYAIVNLDNKNLYNGKTFILKGLMSSDKNDYKNYHGFVSSCYSGEKTIDTAIAFCRIAESFDGRIFLTGNPLYPGFCFYSTLDANGENHPLYFGEMNYFKDGVGNFENTALLAAGDSLAVFKEGDDGGGSIYYHVPESTGIDILPKIYPTSYVHSGFVARGKAISFFDDPVFVSAKGISALAKKNINLERSIETRSTNVNNKLLSEDLKHIKLAIWNGYLVVLAGDKIYLADSRSRFTNEWGEMEYEWYYLSGIGAYRNDLRVFKYSSNAHEGFSVRTNTETTVQSEIYSTKIDGSIVYYTKENGIRYEIYPTGERYGGDFSPASHIISIGDKLIFATISGQIMIFNTDKKGCAPPDVLNSADFDEDEYAGAWGNITHPYYYSFAGHPIRYAMQTKKDNCSIPHMLKSSVKDSLSIKCRAVSGGKIICEVGTDKGGYKEIARFPSTDLFFGDIDFSSLSLSTDNVYTVPIHEKERGWIEKQITLYSDEFCSPFAVYLIAYRFYVKGKIKRNR